MKVHWALSAEQDRIDIFEFVAQDSPQSAIALDSLFSEAADLLRIQPKIGRVGEVAGTRELITHESYRGV